MVFVEYDDCECVFELELTMKLLERGVVGGEVRVSLRMAKLTWGAPLRLRGQERYIAEE